MAEHSEISWTDGTFNPWLGCQRVSPACEHCYAETLVTGRMRLPVWGPPSTTPRKRTAASSWAKPRAWDRAAAKAGRRMRVFCASLADVFEDHPALPPWRADLFTLIEETPNLDWLLLTKRPQNLCTMLPPAWLDNPRPNIWLGTTVEDQRRAFERIAHLLNAPAFVRFLSCEPLLGPLNLDPPICQYCGPDFVEDVRADHDPAWCLRCDSEACYGNWLDPAASPDQPGINWVIAGGESGAAARPMHPDWARALRDQCVAANVPYHFKQWGELVPRSHAPAVVARGDNWGTLDRAGTWWPQTTPWNGHDDDGTGEAVMLRVGKAAAGHLLDGVAWQEFPEARRA